METEEIMVIGSEWIENNPFLHIACFIIMAIDDLAKQVSIDLFWR